MVKLSKMRFSAVLLLVLLTFSAYSCKKDHPPAEQPNVSIELNTTASTLAVAEQMTLTATFTPSVTNAAQYGWKVADAAIAAITVNSDHSATVTAKAAGKTTVTISSPKGAELASCVITVREEAPDDGVVKILAIGNSFSEDALEYYLYGLAAAAGKKVVIGNLYIGGATLDQHMQNANNNNAAYAFRKIGEDGQKTNTDNTSIETALASENWDYISFQQASPNSGQYNTFVTPLQALYSYVKERVTNAQVKYVLHQTWAYAGNSTHEGFANYNKDQETMYEAIVDAYKQAKTLINADVVVPVGTAIQNGRTSVIGDNFNRDGYHLDLNIGRYTASCTWFEAIFGETVLGNSYKPEALSAYDVEIAQHAAHLAIEHPTEVTPMVDYQGGGTGTLTSAVLISFGKDPGSAKWNGVTSPNENTTIPNLKDEQENYTGVSLTIVEPFNNINVDGAKTTQTDFDMPQVVSSDSYFGNPKKEFDGKTIQQTVLRLDGLDKTHKYNFCFFASRMNVAANESRETKFTVKGAGESTVNLESANNNSETACVENMAPDADGKVTIIITAGENNNNTTGFYYLNAMRITASSD